VFGRNEPAMIHYHQSMKAALDLYSLNTEPQTAQFLPT
jgi:hypothetical protein